MSHVLNAKPASIRAGRFTAGITAVLLLVVVVLGFGGADLRWLAARSPSPRCSRGARSPASGAIRSACSSRGSCDPRLAPPDELEDPRPRRPSPRASASP